MTACTFRGCWNPATHRIEGEYDHKPWYGCEQHWPAMDKALQCGQRIDYTVTVTPLDKRRRRAA